MKYCFRSGLFFFIVLISSCASVNKTQLNSVLNSSNCNQQNIYSYTANQLPKPIYQLQIDSAVAKAFSFKSLNVANAIGILDYLTRYVTIKNTVGSQAAIERRLDMLELSQKIHQHINIASIEISAIASEIDCEEERADQIATYLEGKQSETESRLTVGSIVVGAAGAIATGVLLANGNKTNTPEYIGIGTGIAEATLGLMILLNTRKVTFLHPRNVLKEVLEGKEISAAFPVSVWYYLNYYNPSEPEKISLRQQIIDHWMDFGQISSALKNKKHTDIYFEEGGKYTSQQLKNRSNMLDQLEAQINLMKQDLSALAIEVEQL